MLRLSGWNGTDYIYDLIEADPKEVVPKHFGTYKLDIPITELVDVDYNKINESNRTLTNEDNNKTYQIEIINIAKRCKDWNSSRDAGECKIIFKGVPESSAGRSRSSKKRPSARRLRRRSSKRKARKSRTTRRR
jgi:hypothetical protein